MAEVILHIGMNKCGSSSLQSALTQTPSFVSRGGKKYTYLFVNIRGRILQADQCQHLLAGRALPFFNSASFDSFQWTDAKRQEGRSRIEAVEGTSIFSCEGWLSEYEQMTQSRLFNEKKTCVDALAYLRPPVDWINSAWWQWGAWTRQTFDHWLERTLPRLQWADTLGKWRQSPWIRTLRIRLLPLDIVEDFFSWLQAPVPQSVQRNSSMPAEILRFVQAHQDFRPDVHFARFDFVMAKRLNFDSLRPTPWVLNQDAIRRILESTRESSKRIAGMLDDDSRTKMEKDPHWWSENAYRERVAESPDPVPLKADALERLTRATLQALMEIDEKYRGLQASISPPTR